MLEPRPQRDSILPAIRAGGRGSLGWAWLLVIPVAAVVYLIALPFFLLLRGLDWFLPAPPRATTHETTTSPAPEEDAPPELRPR